MHWHDEACENCKGTGVKPFNVYPFVIVKVHEFEFCLDCLGTGTVEVPDNELQYI